MDADKNIFANKTIDDTCCSTLADSIISYIFDSAEYTNNIRPEVNKICNNMNNNEKEVLNNVLNKFYNNLNE